MSAIDFQRQTFGDTTLDKEYILKISSRNKERDLCSYCYQYPFDFTVKFNMDTRYNNNPMYNNNILVDKGFSYKPEAVIYSRFTDIKKLELLDIVIPRFIPSSRIGKIYEGIKLILQPGSVNNYYLSSYPGTTVSYESNMITVKNNKSIIILIPHGTQKTWLKTEFVKYCDHINIDDYVYPIDSVSGNIITVNNITSLTLPSTSKLICANQFTTLFYSTPNPNNITFISSNTITIANLPMSMLNNVFESNVLYITDWNNDIATPYLTYAYYFKIDSFSVDINSLATFKGNLYYNTTIAIPTPTPSYPYNIPIPSTPINVYLFGFGQRDLLEERIFYISIDPFIPVKSTGTSQELDKMFGALFPYTQSRDWIFLRGSSSESFLPTDLRNLDKMHIVIYDADVINLNDVFVKRQQLLCPSYYDGMFTTIITKVSIQTKTLKY
jgi:hypothetical protein